MASKELVQVESVMTTDVVEWVDTARNALVMARDNFERVRIRDHAKAVQEAAAVLGRRDIQVQASVLVQEAEREIAKANPSKGHGGDRRSKGFNVVRDDLEIKPSTMRDIRQGHEPIEDTEFEEIVEEATVEGVPLTRKAWVDIAHKKRRGEAREESAARSRTIILSFQRTKLFPEVRFAISVTPIVFSRILSSMR